MFEQRDLSLFFCLKSDESDNMIEYIKSRRAVIERQANALPTTLTDNMDQSLVDVGLLRDLGNPLNLTANGKPPRKQREPKSHLPKSKTENVVQYKKRKPLTHAQMSKQRIQFQRELEEWKQEREEDYHDQREKYPFHVTILIYEQTDNFEF